MTTNTRYRSRIGSYFRANIPPEERAKLDKQLEEFAVPQREARALREIIAATKLLNLMNHPKCAYCFKVVASDRLNDLHRAVTLQLLDFAEALEELRLMAEARRDADKELS